jgi:superkiller protein 8
MSPDGKFLAATTQDGRVNVYDTTKINEDVKAAQTLAQFETKGSFGTCVDIVRSAGQTDSLLHDADTP